MCVLGSRSVVCERESETESEEVRPVSRGGIETETVSGTGAGAGAVALLAKPGHIVTVASAFATAAGATAGSGPGQSLQQHAMDHQVEVAPYGRRKLRRKWAT